MSVRNKMLITILGYLVVLVVVVLFVIIPSVEKIQTISQEVYDQQLYLEELYMRGQLIKRVQRQLAEINPFIEKMTRGFVDPEQSVDFVLSLEGLAQNNNIVQRIEMRPERAVQRNIYEILPVHLSLEGNFINLIKYLKGAEEMDYYFNVGALNIASPKTRYGQPTPGSGQLNILLQGQSYWLR
jgi:Tfp pilus assembly protein PilO